MQTANTLQTPAEAMSDMNYARVLECLIMINLPL